MMPLDDIIARMKVSNCNECECLDATADGNNQDSTTGQNIELHGSFCILLPGHTHIAIIAKDKETGQEVWSKVCDTGHICSIPFTSETGFICEDDDVC